MIFLGLSHLPNNSRRTRMKGFHSVVFYLVFVACLFVTGKAHKWTGCLHLHDRMFVGAAWQILACAVVGTAASFAWRKLTNKRSDDTCAPPRVVYERIFDVQVAC
jgi:hypothetical protein